MAEEVVKYSVGVSFDTALKKLDNFSKKMNSFSKSQETSLKRQISLQRQLNKLRMQGNVGGAKVVKSPTTASPPSSSRPMADNNAHIKEREHHLVRQQKAEEARLRNLERSKKAVKRTAFWMEKSSNSAQKEVKAVMRKAVAEAKNADEVRDAVASARARMRVLKQQEKSLRNQNFLLKRMQSSSEQFAGNMVSAFAVAAGGAAVIQTGQEFESVNNTMLAVSSSAKEAGENFEFVRNEAFRLGTDLASSGKNFAKMLSARGEMSLEDTKAAFTGVAEMSTLLGLSSEASGRAINALQQMMSKGVVSAEEFTVY